MNTRTKAGITGVALATGAALMVGAPSASGDHQSESSAYGVSIGGQAGEPAVEYKGGETQTGGGQLPAELGPLAAGGVLTLSAGDDTASAQITDLTLAQAIAELPAELKEGIAQLTQACTAFDEAGDANQAIDPLNDAIDQIPGGIGTVVDLPTTEAASAFCNALLDADILNLAEVGTLLSECVGNTGTVTLTDVKVLGAEQPVLAGKVPAETSLLPAELAPIATITLNHQVTDGESFTVEGLRVEVGGEELAVLASATCGGPIAHEPRPQPGPRPAPAPVPTPVQQSVPVTG